MCVAVYSTGRCIVRWAVADLTDEAEENLDDGTNSTVSERLRITTLPTFLLLKDGIEVARAEGAAHKRPARRLFTMLKNAVGV